MRIAWLTNHQAPYREPMWRELHGLAELRVGFLFAAEPVRQWTWRPDPGYRSSVVSCVPLPLPKGVTSGLEDHAVMLAPGVARRVLDRADVLVIHEWWQPAFVWCALRARWGGTPYILFSESTLTSRRMHGGLPGRLREWMYRNAGAVVAPSRAAAQAAVADGTPAARVVESMNSIDVSQFGRRARGLRSARFVRSGEAGHRFVYVGQLVERKNVATLVRAFAALEGRDTLDIAGDGVELAALRSLAAECGVPDRVRFLGFLDEPEVVELLAGCHTLVLPSTQEVYGFTALEAYVAGLQVAVSEVAGIAPDLAGRPGVWVVQPDQHGLGRALREARDGWRGWRGDPDVEQLAGPGRAAADVLRAAALAIEEMRPGPVTRMVAAIGRWRSVAEESRAVRKAATGTPGNTSKASSGVTM